MGMATKSKLGHGQGTVRQLPSKRWQAKRRLEAGGAYVSAPFTFDTKLDAEAWLTEHGDKPNPASVQTPDDVLLSAYAATWLATRTLAPRTRDSYQRLLRCYIGPALGDIALVDIKPATVREWYAKLPENTTRQASYSLLATILNTAVEDEIVATNPCKIKSGRVVERQGRTVPATVAELAAIVEAMPPRLRAMVLLAGWCGFRFGEVAELRRKDVDLATGEVYVGRGVVHLDGKFIVGKPKTKASVRTVAIPPHIVPAIAAHLDNFVHPSPEALLFTASFDRSRHIARGSMYYIYDKARGAAGRTDLRFHDLRHSAAVFAAEAGANLKDSMSRFGQATGEMALHYQHVREGRDQALARRMSEQAGWTPEAPTA